MEARKAVRHIVLAEASIVIRALLRAHHRELAGAVEGVVARIEWLDGEAPPARDEGEAGRTVRISVRGEDHAPMEVALSGFSLHTRASGAWEPVNDAAMAVNRGAARTVLRELLTRSLGSPLAVPLEEALGAPGNHAPPDATGARAHVRAPDPVAAAIVVAAAFIAFWLTWWQGHAAFNWVDSSYLLENLNRILRGEVPYRDFGLVLGPAHYLLSAAVYAGTGVQGLVAFAGIVQAAQVVVAFYLCAQMCESPRTCALLALIVAFGGSTHWGFPLYDCEAGLWGSLSLLLLLAGPERPRAPIRDLSSGIFAGVACITKLNSGASLVVGTVLGLFAAALLYRHRARRALAYLGGVALPIGGVLVWLAVEGALGAFWQNTIVLPAQERLSVIHYLIESLPLRPTWGDPVNGMAHGNLVRLVVAIGLLLPFVTWFTGIHRRPMQLVLMVPVMTWLFGTMQSQAYGSVYGVYGLLALILAAAWRWVTPLVGARRASVAVGVLAVLLAASGLSDVLARKRLTWLLGDRLTTRVPFSLPALRGLGGDAASVRALEGTVARFSSVPPAESVFVFPGFSPFYLASGRTCPLPNFQVLAATGFPPETLALELERAQVTWLLFDRTMDDLVGLTGIGWRVAAAMPQIRRQYRFLGAADGVDIWRRNSP